MFLHKLIIFGFLAIGLLGLEDKIPLLFGASPHQQYSPGIIQQLTGYPPERVQLEIRLMGMQLRSHLGDIGYRIGSEMQQLQIALQQQDLLPRL